MVVVGAHGRHPRAPKERGRSNIARQDTGATPGGTRERVADKEERGGGEARGATRTTGETGNQKEEEGRNAHGRQRQHKGWPSQPTMLPPGATTQRSTAHSKAQQSRAAHHNVPQRGHTGQCTRGERPQRSNAEHRNAQARGAYGGTTQRIAARQGSAPQQQPRASIARTTSTSTNPMRSTQGKRHTHHACNPHTHNDYRQQARHTRTAPTHTTPRTTPTHNTRDPNTCHNPLGMK